MANFNKVFLMGNLTRDPELRYTPSGLAVTQFGLAINRRYTSKEGEQKEDVCFVEIEAFGRQAEVLSEYMSKGSPLFVEGRLRYSSWQDKQGQKRTKLSVVADGFQFLGGKRGAPTGEAPEAKEAQDEPPPPEEPPPPPPPPPDVKKDNIPF
ncbi:MAG: single-stranded DNA-binding protein [Planctomycetes bacterium]|nr:single-stranded DNA-binding protein [Planctomycetota bacterium]MBM4079579.1 single-stranded DNA-binding protein [Planctomycetota bacterium]